MSTFQKKLFDMAGRGEAYVFRSHDRNISIVPTGKYAGTWTYNKINKRLSYQSCLVPKPNVVQVVDKSKPEYFGFGPNKTTVYYLKKKAVAMPLPQFVYENANKDYNFTNNKSWMFHAKEKKRSSGEVYRWKVFQSRYLNPFQAIADTIAEKMFEYELLPSSEVVVYILGLACPQVLKAFSENSKSASHAMEWLVNPNSVKFLQGMGSRKRQRFVCRVFDMGIKKAMKKSFPRAHPATRNVIINSRILTFKTAKLLSWTRKPLCATVFGFIEMTGVQSTSDKRRMESIGSKYGSTGLSSFVNFRAELLRARRMNLDMAKYNLELNVSPKLYAKWHNEIATIIREHLDKADVEKNTLAELAHEYNWDELYTPSEITPLITKEDFHKEHKIMNHCIDGYFRDTDCLFGHVEMTAESATFMINKSDGRIVQLYGPRNQPVSATMHNFVNMWSLNSVVQIDHLTNLGLS